MISFKNQNVCVIADERWRQEELSNEEALRYSRHLIMPEVAKEGQQKLKASKVLLIGTGGLGSPLALYLSAAGVGTLGLVDFDQVDYTNLHRQVIHFTDDVGKPKLQSANEKIERINPEVDVKTYETRINSDNALDIINEYDIVIDGTDNFPTRYLVNDACVLLGKPNVYGSIFRFEGQASVFFADRGPCYRCLYPEPPPPGLVPSCAEGGVLGILPGLIGLVQATEAIKLIIGQGEPLIGRLLLLDSLGMRWREMKLRKNPQCPICGENPTITSLIDYEEFCGISRGGGSVMEANALDISPAQLRVRIERGDRMVLLDVREEHELSISKLQNIVHIPMNDVPDRISELKSDADIICICRSGGRSGQVAEFLRQQGFEKTLNMVGGMNAYAQDVDPNLAVY